MNFLTICNDSGYFLRHWRHASDELARLGHNVVVLTGGAVPMLDPAAWRHEHQPVERYRLSPLADLGLMMKTARLLYSQKPDAVHLITLKPVLFGGLTVIAHRALMRRRTRIVASLPGLGRLFSDNGSKGRLADIARWLTFSAVRFLARQPDVFFTFETGEDFRFWRKNAGVEESKVWVMRGVGVDDAVYFPANHNFEGPPLKVLFASRLLRSKGLDVFIEAARRLVGTGQFEFLVAGMKEPDDPDAIAHAALEAENSIRFLGEVSDMAELLRRTDIVCLPTRYGEGVPRILIEAAACGLPAIAGNSGGCSEIIENGVTGFLIQSEPAIALAELKGLLEMYAEDPELAGWMGKQALAKFKSEGFSLDHVRARLVSLITRGALDT